MVVAFQVLAHRCFFLQARSKGPSYGRSRQQLLQPSASQQQRSRLSADHTTPGYGRLKFGRRDTMKEMGIDCAYSMRLSKSSRTAVQVAAVDGESEASVTVAIGDEVEVHYTGTLDDGTTFDCSREKGRPLKFKVGDGRLIAGFDDAVIGLAEGGTRKIRVDAVRAYGERREDLIAKIPLADVPGAMRVGLKVELSNGMPAVVTEVTQDFVTVDANHMLAGQALTFEVEIVSIFSAMEKFPFKKTDDEWRKELSPQEYQVIREKGTEPARTGEYDKFYPEKGYFVCRACKNPLYTARAKFDSGCGWPAFDKCFEGAVAIEIDNSFGMRRVEIMCANCGGHLGHVFEGERLTETNERHCVNSISVKYLDEDVPEDLKEAKVV